MSLFIPEPPDNTKSYLGDGVYATWSGYDIELLVANEEKVDRIYLDDSVLQALIKFRERFKNEDINKSSSD